MRTDGLCTSFAGELVISENTSLSRAAELLLLLAMVAIVSVVPASLADDRDSMSHTRPLAFRNLTHCVVQPGYTGVNKYFDVMHMVEGRHACSRDQAATFARATANNTSHSASLKGRV